MAFGVKRAELNAFKEKAMRGEIAILTHYWLDERFPSSKTVTKVASSDIDVLKAWGKKYQLPEAYIDFGHDHLPHFDLFGEIQLSVLKNEAKWDQINRFHLEGEKHD